MNDPQTNKRNVVVSLAATQLGPQNPDTYWSVVCPALCGHPHDVSWCGGFALTILRQAGLCDWSWRIGHGFVYDEHGKPRLPTTLAPKPGDIAYFQDHNQHYAIVKELAGDRLHTIDGNQGVKPLELVTERERQLSTSGAVFYSIEGLVEAALSAQSAAVPPTVPSATSSTVS